MRIQSSRILGNAVAERPVFFRNFEQVDEHVFPAQAWLLREQFDDAGEQRFFLLDAARVADGDLQDHQIIGPRNVHIGLAELEFAL